MSSPAGACAALRGSASMAFVWTAPGTPAMGSSTWDDLGWQAAMGTVPWDGQDRVHGDEQHPAAYVSWEDVQRFVQAQNERTAGSHYRLPTEAEWVQDWCGPFSSGPQTDLPGPAQGSFRVVRGGAWRNHRRLARSALRDDAVPTAAHVDVGARLARLH